MCTQITMNSFDKQIYEAVRKNFHRFDWQSPFTGDTIPILHKIRDKKIILPAQHKFLGKGSFGTVYKVAECNWSMKKCDYDSFAIKVVPLIHGVTKKHVLMESEIGKLYLHGEWGVFTHIYTYFKFQGVTYGLLLMDNILRKYQKLFKQSTLHSYVKKYGLTTSLKRTFAQTMKMFYSRAKVHGDLHDRNILVIHDDDGYVIRVKIIDYFTLIANESVKFSNNNSVYQRMKKSEKILINNKTKQKGNITKVNKQSRGANASKILKNKSIPIYRRSIKNNTLENRSSPKSRILFRKNTNVLSYWQPQLMNFLKKVEHPKKVKYPNTLNLNERGPTKTRKINNNKNNKSKSRKNE